MAAYQAVESSSHVNHSSVDHNCGIMYVSMGWIAAEKKPGKTGKHDAMPELPESLKRNRLSLRLRECKYCISSLSNVHL